MIGALHSLSRHIRVWVVMALACLTIGSVLSSARANIVTATHLVHGEKMLQDGGWTSACDIRVEHCSTNETTVDPDSPYGLHHHHHADYQFGTVEESASASRLNRRGRPSLPTYAAVIKTAPPSSADQPPKI